MIIGGGEALVWLERGQDWPGPHAPIPCMNASSAAPGWVMPVHVVTDSPAVACNEHHLLCQRTPRAVGADPRGHATFRLPCNCSPGCLAPRPPSLYMHTLARLSSSGLGRASRRSSRPLIKQQLSSGAEREHKAVIKFSPSSSMDQPVDMEVNKQGGTAIERDPSGVTYCCGACGYDLRLRSSDRNTAGIVGGYYDGRAVRRGVVAFDAIDDARFGHAEEFRCLDVRARRLFVRRTRLLCRKCGASLGFGYDDRGSNPSSSSSPRYDIRIRALQPLVAAEPDDAAS